MNKRLLLLIPLVVLVSASLTIGGIFLFRQANSLKKAHYHAGFHVYIDGKLQDFSGAKYMKTTPCALTESKNSLAPEEEQLDKAHLHDNIGQVVHSHLKPAYWGDLFENIHYHLDTEKTIKSYVNGKEIKDILKYKIEPYDSVVIILGEHGDTSSYLEKAVTKDEIIKEEQKSEDCGS